MTVTLTATYKDVLKTETVDQIDALIEDNHDLQCMLEFIDENSEEDFCTYYEDYVEQGENVGYSVVDAFVAEYGIADVASVGDAFVGCYDSEAAFAEEWVYENENVPDCVVVDWEVTWDRCFKYDFDFVTDGAYQGYVFRRYY